MEFNLKSNKLIIAGLAAVFLVTGSLGYYFWTRGEVSTDDAFVDGHVFIITPRVAGYVTKVPVDDNERVKKGQAMVVLDPTPSEVAVAQARATLAESKFTLASLQLGVPLQLAQTTEQVRGAKAELDSLHKTVDQLTQDEATAAEDVKRLQAQFTLAQVDVERNRALRQSGAVSQQTLDNAETTYRSAEAQLKGSEAKFESVKKQLAAQEADIQLREANVALAATGTDQAEIKARQTEAQQAKVDLAKEQLKQAELDLGYTTIQAPTNGYVTEKKIEPGQYVSTGQQLFALVPMDRDNVWITANYKETQLTDVRPGQPVDIEVDTYPDVVIRGKVNSIMSGTGAVFSLFPPENATGNFVKVVQRIPVKITIDAKDWSSLPALRIGMSVVPTIYTLGGPHGRNGDKQMAHHHSGDAADAH
jgi:membrane fusion protein (multidrug efflux system)